MKKLQIQQQALLSTLWIFILLNMIFRDLHQFAHPGFLEEIMGLELEEELVLIFGFVLEVPILMVVLSRVLNDQANKWTNIGAVLFTAMAMLSAASTADLDDIFFMIMEFGAMLVIVLIAWRLPRFQK